MLRLRGANILREAVSPSKAIEAENNVDEELGKMTEGIGQNAGNRAPVLTGHLSRSLRDGSTKVGHLHYQLVQGVYDHVPYLFRQNFEHQTKRYFLTTSFNEMESAFKGRLDRAVDKTWP